MVGMIRLGDKWSVALNNWSETVVSKVIAQERIRLHCTPLSTSLSVARRSYRRSSTTRPLTLDYIICDASITFPTTGMWTTLLSRQ